MAFPTVGTTLSVRAQTAVGPVTVVGVVVAADESQWTLRRRDGSLMTVQTRLVDAHRVVPPPRSAQIPVDELERLMAAGWRALETEQLGDWLLRAAGGFTGRANSALCAGSPGVELDAALGRVVAWYGERGLPPRLQVPLGAEGSALESVLDDRGWSWSPRVHVMTAEVAHVLRAGEAAPRGRGETQLSDAPDADWLATYRQAAAPLPDVARTVLANHPAAVFASVRRGGRTVAVARAAIDGKWAGLSSVEVVPTARRDGLGIAVSVAALREAGHRGARQVYLQVSSDNPGAVAMYERLNFTVHHDYVYAAAS